MIFNKDPEVMKAVATQIQKTAFFEVNNKKRQTMAAVMFTDIVGYTTMMDNDQESAMELLEKNRKLHRTCIEQHGGCWIKEMGDGILASFDTASDAVECALDLQRNSQLISGLKLRIGIHLGQVVFTETDIFGIVVNIASRLQCLAKPGQILVSASVAQRISSTINCKVNCIGNRRLKNVKKPVNVHRIGDENEPVPFSWWLVTAQFPVQKAMAAVLLISSLFRF